MPTRPCAASLSVPVGSWVAGSRTIDAIWGIGSVAGDAGNGESFGIGPVGVAVVAFEENGAIGEKFIEIFLVGKSFGAEHGVVPAATEEPIIAGMLGGVIAQALLNVGDVFGAFEIDAAETDGAVEKVNVAIDEAGQNELARGVDHFGAGLAKFFDGGVVADGDDFVGANGESLGPGLFGVESVDAAVENDGVGAAFCFFGVLRVKRRGCAEE